MRLVDEKPHDNRKTLTLTSISIKQIVFFEKKSCFKQLFKTGCFKQQLNKHNDTQDPCVAFQFFRSQ